MAHHEPIAKAVIADCELGDSAEQLAHEFLDQRPRLLGIAYRMLGTMWDAEDIVADAMVGRWLDRRPGPGAQPGRVPDEMVTRRALDPARSAASPGTLRRRVAARADPHDTVTAGPPRHGRTSRVVSLATLRVMERLTPPERAVFVLTRPSTCPSKHRDDRRRPPHQPGQRRQHLQRARFTSKRRPPVDPESRRTARCSSASSAHSSRRPRRARGRAGERCRRSDGGGKARARPPSDHGGDKVITFFGAAPPPRDRGGAKDRGQRSTRGTPLIRPAGPAAHRRLRGDKIREIRVAIMNPDKLEYLRAQLAAGPTN